MFGNIPTTLALLLIVTHSANYHRLQGSKQLSNGDEIVSTLGRFKLQLASSDCSLNLHSFDEARSVYSATGQKYQGLYQGTCSHLEVKGGAVMTNGSRVFLQLRNSSLSRVYLAIDDEAVIRLIGFNPNSDPSAYQEVTVSTFQQTNTYVKTLTAFQSVSEKLGTLMNDNRWMFSLAGQELTITNFVTRVAKTFTLPAATFAPTGIFDPQNQTLPFAFFEGITTQNTCSGTPQDFLSPFVLKHDQYWPILTLFDQGGAIVFEWAVSNNSGTSNPCPKFTYLHKSECVITCLQPYYHSIEDDRGRCILKCEEGATVDEAQRQCRCPNRFSFHPPDYTCVNSTKYAFGCHCLANGSFFDRSTQKCTTECEVGTVAWDGICTSCPVNCTACQRQASAIAFNCTQCQTGFRLLKEGYCQAVGNCSSNCLVCDNGVCVSCRPFFALSDNACVETCPVETQLLTFTNMTSECGQSTVQSCPQGCLRCSSSDFSACLVCKPGYAFMITPLTAVCKRMNILYRCDSLHYTQIHQGKICYASDSTSQPLLSQCASSIGSCLVCHPQLSNTCLVCSSSFYLKNNICVSSCGSGYTLINQACVNVPARCSRIGFTRGQAQSPITTASVLTNPIYSSAINNGLTPTNEPTGFQLFSKSEFVLNSTSISVDTQVIYQNQICQECEIGYGLSPDYTQCLPCPSGCLLCYYADTCVASTAEEMLSYTLGGVIATCQQFLTDQFQCRSSCPEGTYPHLNSTIDRLTCANPTTTPSVTTSVITVDGSTFQLDDNTYIHRFVFSETIKSQGTNVTTTRLLQSMPSTDSTRNTLTVKNSDPTYVLNLQGNLANFQSDGGQYLGNSRYGLNEQTSFREYIKEWLAFVGYIFSIILICLHCIFVGNGLLYKMDNIIIFSQSLFFCLFLRTLVSNPVAQYFYGWSWLHLNFYPNYFSASVDSAEPTAPPYALYNIDANIIRNAGYAISFLLTFALAWALISLVVYILDSKYSRKELWYGRIALNSFIAAFELLSYSIMYWCVAFLSYDQAQQTLASYIGLSVLILVIMLIYCLLRLYYDRIGGLYMVKRILLATVMASSYQHIEYVAIIIVIQLLFGVARVVIQAPKKKEMVMLWIEQGCLVVFWLIAYLVTDASAVSILISLFIYAWMLTFVADLVDLYLATKNKSLQLLCWKKDESEVEQVQYKYNQQKGQTDRNFESHATTN